MLDIKTKTLEISGKNYEFETGRFANQADFAVVCKSGDTHVLCTVTYAKKASENTDFFPLTVNYIEKFYAFGKIPGGFIKREGKVSEKETLTSRVIDRAIRPMFPENFHNEVQIICTLLSYDSENDAETVAMMGACFALKMSGLPIIHTISGLRVGLVNDEFVINPAQSVISSENCILDLFMAGGNSSIVMVESGCCEISESKMLDALEFGQKNIAKVVDFFDSVYSELGKEKFEFTNNNEELTTLTDEILQNFATKFAIACDIHDKKKRHAKLDEVKTEILAIYKEKIDNGEFSENLIKNATYDSIYHFVRGNILNNSKRIGDRKFDEVREICIQEGLLPRVHGSALFCRGETQALVVTTLGSAADMQLHEGVEGMFKEKFMLHYNFPPFSVGEVGQLRAPGRREIGHGKLAQRAILPMLNITECAYTVRCVSEILTCNGSSSMASVCGASLSLMSAGINIKKHVAGIAMGLVKEDEKCAILTDIMADEDFLGDMDFKVAGTRDGITALQMDIKIDGISKEILQKALEQAKKARLEILDKMYAAIAEPKENSSEFTPYIEKIAVNPKSIGEIIGKGGATIKQLSEENKCKIDIDENGEVSIYGAKADVAKVKEIILMIVSQPQRGEIYDGVVTEIKSFGAMVKFLFNKSGMVHISQISNKRVEDINEFLSVSQAVKVKYLGLDEKRRVKLSIANRKEEKNDVAAENETTADIEIDSSELIESRLPSESDVQMLKSSTTYYTN